MSADASGLLNYMLMYLSPSTTDVLGLRHTRYNYTSVIFHWNGTSTSTSGSGASVTLNGSDMQKKML